LDSFQNYKMKLPKEIKPNPLVTSTVEIRFHLNIEKTKLLPLVYKKFQNELPNLNETVIPKQIKELDPQFKYSPDFVLSNNDFSLSFGINVLSFENVDEYKLWGNYFPFIVNSLKGFYEFNIITQIERIGVRYVSVFDRTEKISDVINSVPTLPFNDYNQKFGVFRCDLIRDEVNLHLQIADNVKVIKNTRVLSGSCIDIDAFYGNKLNPDEKVFEIIDKLHLQQKEVFISLLKKSFLDSLTVIY
jgi:uncharacterized protein (TIGR04255 family)